MLRNGGITRHHREGISCVRLLVIIPRVIRQSKARSVIMKTLFRPCRTGLIPRSLDGIWQSRGT